MVNQSNNEEQFISKTDYYRENVLNQLKSTINENEELEIELFNPFIDQRNEINSNYNHFYSNNVNEDNFFKQYKMALDELLDDLDQNTTTSSTQSTTPTSLLEFQKESLNIINRYIDEANSNYNQTIESIKQRYELINNQNKKCLNLFNNLINDYEDLEIDILDYLNY